MKKQNIEYFKEKARDLIQDKDPDGINMTTAKMLIKELGMKVDDFISASKPQK